MVPSASVTFITVKAMERMEAPRYNMQPVSSRVLVARRTKISANSLKNKPGAHQCSVSK